jgi:hypothetical protein
VCGARCLHRLSLQRSVIRCRPLLGGVPWVGSPASSLVLRHSDFLSPVASHYLLSRLVTAEIHRPETKGPPRFLGNPSRTCPGLRPRRDHEPGHSGAPDFSAQRYCLPRLQARRLPQLLHISRLNPTACVLAVYDSEPAHRASSRSISSRVFSPRRAPRARSRSSSSFEAWHSPVRQLRGALSVKWPLSWAHAAVGDELSFVRLFVLIEPGECRSLTRGTVWVSRRDRSGAFSSATSSTPKACSCSA